MRSLLLVLVAVSACTSHAGPGTGEIAMSNSAAALPASKARGQATAYFANGSLDRAICQAATTLGACIVRTKCQGNDEPVTHYSAGAITIGTAITLTPDVGGSYGGAGIADGRYVAPNTPLSLHATGDQISSFELSLTSPEPLTVLAPARTTTEVARTSDLAIVWSGITTGTVSARITNGLDISSSIDCTFAGADGVGTISAAALALFGSASGSLAITAHATATTTVDAWDVRFLVIDDAAWADGSTGALALAFHD